MPPPSPSAAVFNDPSLTDELEQARDFAQLEAGLSSRGSQDALADVNFTPHGTVFALLSAAIKIRDMVKAEKFFDHLVKDYKFTQPHVFNAMMEGYMEVGNPAKAFKVFKQMLAIDLKPSKLSLITIVRALAQ